MPITQNKRLLKAVRSHTRHFGINSENVSLCPVCRACWESVDGWLGECEHLLCLDTGCSAEPAVVRACWACIADPEVRTAWEDSWEYRAHPTGIRFLDRREWVPVPISYYDCGGQGFQTWVAFPATLFGRGKKPANVVARMIALAEETAEVGGY